MPLRYTYGTAFGISARAVTEIKKVCSVDKLRERSVLESDLMSRRGRLEPQTAPTSSPLLLAHNCRANERESPHM